MFDAHDFPYGALYSFEPDYVRHLLHEEKLEEDQEAETPASFGMYIRNLIGHHLTKQ